LKVLAANLMKTERARQLFEREVRAAARLIHPNIVTAYDANQIDDRHYLVMEFVDGPNLQELVKERGPLPVGQACELIRQAALGLQYAHDMGMVHRDIKPANLLVHRGNGQGYAVKILDFGLARLYEPNADPADSNDSLPAGEQQVMGTPDYLSPEQARNLHSADGRSDLYSLGCAFYYLLVGRVPFPGGTSLEKLVRHGSEMAAPVEELRPEVGPEISAIVARLMAKKPEDRFQSATELAVMLAPYSVQSGGALPAISGGLGLVEPVSGDSPWADIFGVDEHAGGSTISADSGPTPMGSSRQVNRMSRRSTPAAPPGMRPWIPLIVLGVAVAIGFLLGVVTLFIFRK
jgi:serine/threonine protein kinase